MRLRMTIRKKILCGTILMVCTLSLLMISSLRGVYAYRELALMISQRSNELLAILEIQKEGHDLQASLGDRGLLSSKRSPQEIRESALHHLDNVGKLLASYEAHVKVGSGADREQELHLLSDIRTSISVLTRHWSGLDIRIKGDNLLLREYLDLSDKLLKLSISMNKRMASTRDEVRSRYRTWIFFVSTSAIASILILGVAFWYFRTAIVQPFKLLLDGTRKIAKENIEHRIELQSEDELAELGNALNDMTRRFLEIRDNLNEKVQQQTREVVRSEQLASVGFLAAGVAHEINNPLASIAWSAEALEGRLHEILHTQSGSQEEGVGGAVYDQQELEVLRRYLKRIQDEAFRCKGITERLLDFSRLGESQRKQATDINESISDVIALVQHLGQYRNKKIEYSGQLGLTAWVSPPEFKQVVLNLLTNALDSLDDGGVVAVKLEHNQSHFTLTVKDNGCGMNEEVLNHLFEPFFTRRRDGRGTGLGLSITYRIVQDHAGTLTASSPGMGLGSTFVLQMPLDKHISKSHESIKSAA